MAKKLSTKQIKSYVTSRADEALKEQIANDELLMENKAFRDIFIGGFFAGMSTHAKIMADVGERMLNDK